LKGDKRGEPPADDELEVSIFGPGKGECIVVHVPNGPWFVVDSHIVRDSGGERSVAAAYLKDTLGVESVFGVFFTHWHSDHTGGALSLLEAFAPAIAVVGLPAAFSKQELASYLADQIPEDETVKPIRDLLGTMSFLEKNKAVDRVRLTYRVNLAPSGAAWNLEALSPSAEDEKGALAELTDRRSSYDRNSTSVVLRLEVAGMIVILCSDLPKGKNDLCGWRRIVATQGSRLVADIVKVGHHGSSTAFYEPAWSLMGQSGRTVAGITPFPAAKGHLPRPEMVKEIGQHCDRLFISAEAKNSSRAGRVSIAHTPFVRYTPVRTVPFSNVGHIRVRMLNSGAPPNVELFGGAFERSK
jgi:hypothetical protein